MDNAVGPFRYPPMTPEWLARFAARQLARPEPGRSRAAAELWPHVVRVCGRAVAEQIFNAAPPLGGVIPVPGLALTIPAAWRLSVDSNRDSLLPVGSELPILVSMTWAGRSAAGGTLWGGVAPGDAAGDAPGDAAASGGRAVSFRADAGGCAVWFRYGSFRGRAAGPFAGKLALVAPLADFLPPELVPAGGGRIQFSGDFGA